MIDNSTKNDRDADICKQSIIDKQSYGKIAHQHSISRERVRQIVMTCMKRMEVKVKLFGMDSHIAIQSDTHEGKPITRDRVLKLKVATVPFSMRTYNVLMENDIKTIGQLVEFGERRLKRLRHMGCKSIAEVKVILDRYGLSLGV